MNSFCICQQVRFLGLCRRDGLYGQELKEAFIVQEWCAGNLRHVIEVHTNSAGGAAPTYHNPGHDVEFLGRCVPLGSVFASYLCFSGPWICLFALAVVPNKDHGLVCWFRYFAPISRVVRIALQLSQGMAYLHERGIVHRDLKPENVLLSVGEHPHVRICDFGISSSRFPLKKGGASDDAHSQSDTSRIPASTATVRSSTSSIRGLTSPFSSLSTVSSEHTDFAQAVGTSSRSGQNNGGCSSDRFASWDSDLKIGTIE